MAEQVKKIRVQPCTVCEKMIIVQRITRDSVYSEYVSKDGACFQCAATLREERKHGDL